MGTEQRLLPGGGLFEVEVDPEKQCVRGGGWLGGWGLACHSSIEETEQASSLGTCEHRLEQRAVCGGWPSSLNSSISVMAYWLWHISYGILVIAY